ICAMLTADPFITVLLDTSVATTDVAAAQFFWCGEHCRLLCRPVKLHLLHPSHRVSSLTSVTLAGRNFSSDTRCSTSGSFS
ncbi:hypothetical protein KI387_025147, partial [Taxus chinensis]